MAELSRYPITFGSTRGLIYRRPDSTNGNWYFRVFIKEISRYIRKSLKTRDIREAKRFAEDELLNLLTKRKSGQALVSCSFIDAWRQFQLHEEKCANDDVKGYSQRTVDLHGHYIRQVCRYVTEKFPSGIRTKLSSINGKKDFEGYLEWRKNQSTVSRTSINAELVCLRMVMRHAVKSAQAPESCIPTWEFELEETPKRKKLNPETDYQRVVTVLKGWVKEAKGEIDVYNRELLHHFFLIQAQTGLRTGELKQLKWSDIRDIDTEALDAVIHIRREITKVRKERDVVMAPSSGGKVDGTKINYLLRWREKFARYTAADDYIFSIFSRGDVYAQDALYRGMSKLKKILKSSNLEWYDLYHNRHLYASKAILSGVPLAVIANGMGSSVSMIEKHYSHLISEQSTREIANRKKLREK